MNLLLKSFLEICLLKRAPQDLPASHFLLVLSLITHSISGALLSGLSLSPGQAVLAGLLDTGLLLLLAGSLLYAVRFRSRIVQTVTALAGAGTLLGLLAVPITWWLRTTHEAGGDVGLPAILTVIVVFWSITVSGHILRHALSTLWMVALPMAVLFYWIAIIVLNSAFPIE